MTVTPSTVPRFSNLRLAPLNLFKPTNKSATGAPNLIAVANAAVAFSTLWLPGIVKEISPRTFPNLVIRA